jgi:hypothetical protein
MGEQAQFGPVERRLRRGIYRCTYEFSSGEFVDARLEYLNLGTRTWTGTPDNKNKRTAGESVNLFRGWMGRSFVAQAALRREGSQFKELAICLRAFVIVDTGSSSLLAQKQGSKRFKNRLAA